MRDALTHRGPDEAGEYFHEQVALGHRRLSIVDVLAGQQPFASSDGSLVVVFNGEIYNHPDLRRRLQTKGHHYRTDCDTESIINAYREYGIECPKYLDGMFAFVLLDKKNNKLFGARDRFGKKPLYYSFPNLAGHRGFAFASEIRALLRYPAVEREAKISTTSLQSYLLHDYVPSSQSIFGNIWKLEAGHAFQINASGENSSDLSVWQYWRNPILEASAIKVSETEAVS